MSEKLPLTDPERLKWFRNVNLLGAGALLLAAPYATAAIQPWLFASAAINTGEAGVAELWRQRKLNKQKKSSELAIAA